ncbi:hypothetical protein RI367_005672 [Sorochytrium milnesiophthora]
MQSAQVPQRAVEERARAAAEEWFMLAKVRGLVGINAAQQRLAQTAQTFATGVDASLARSAQKLKATRSAFEGFLSHLQVLDAALGTLTTLSERIEALPGQPKPVVTSS